MKESNRTFQELAGLNLKNYQTAISIFDEESRVSFSDPFYNENIPVTLVLLETCVVYVTHNKDNLLLLDRLREENIDWLTDIIRFFPEIHSKLLICQKKLEKSVRLRKML